MQPEDLSKVVHVKIPPQYLQHGVQTEGKKQPAGTYVWKTFASYIHAYVVMHITIIVVHVHEMVSQMLDANPPKNPRTQTEDINGCFVNCLSAVSLMQLVAW